MGTKHVDTQAKGKSGGLTKGTYGGEASGPVGHERVPASVEKLGLHGSHTLSKDEGRMHMKHSSGEEQAEGGEGSKAEEKAEGEGY